jgi:hypothetical protein
LLAVVGWLQRPGTVGMEEGMAMNVREVLKSQYQASLEMLRQAIAQCPERLWRSRAYENEYWHIVYHVLFYTHFYLHPSESDFVPWEKQLDEYTSLGGPGAEVGGGSFYDKEDLLAYHALCLDQVEKQLNTLDLEAESGFHWLPFDKLELQLYNIRHIQQHTGELCERLDATGEVEVQWVGAG